jgi:hypothetical protein
MVGRSRGSGSIEEEKRFQNRRLASASESRYQDIAHGCIDAPVQLQTCLSKKAQRNLRLVASIKVVVRLVPVTRRGHGLATPITSSITLGSLGIALSGHTRSAKVVALLIPASASRGRTYSSVSKVGWRFPRRVLLRDSRLTLIHGVLRAAILGEEASGAVVKSSIGLRRSEVVELTGRRSILAPL